MLRYLYLLLLFLCGCTVTVTEKSLLPDMASPPAPVKTPPDGYLVEQALVDLGDLGHVNVWRMDNPVSDDTHLYSGGRRYLTTRPSQRAVRLGELTGADLIFYDYPGRNGTDMQLTTENLIKLGPALVEALKKRGWIGDGLLVAHGYSLGGSIGASFARAGDFDGLILENTTDDIDAFSRANLPLPLRPFFRFTPSPSVARFDFLAYVKSANVPVLLFSGTKDRIVPQTLVENFRNKLAAEGVAVRYVSTPESHGNAIYTVEGGNAIRDFYRVLRENKPTTFNQ